jgi:excinuclease ABC subunit A
MQDKIIIKGAKKHNLKNIDLELPRNKFIVFTGLSGSGKSTLAFDTIFAEGQRRYLESLSSYARQFLGQMDKPEVEYIEGLSPAISIDQKSVSRNPRSTVGTITEIHDYLRLLYAKIGVPHCPECNKEIKSLSIDEIVDRILEIGEGKKIEIISPIVRNRKGEYSTLLENMYKSGYSRAQVNGKEINLSDWKDVKLERYKKHKIDIYIDETKIGDNNISRIFEGVERAIKLSQGLVIIKSGKKEFSFNQNLACPDHEIEFPELEPRLFSFNSPYGACPSCEGLGSKREVDSSLIIPDKNKTIGEGGVLPWSYKRNNYLGTILRAVMNYYHIPDNVRIKDFSKNDLETLLYGTEGQDLIEVRYNFRSGVRKYYMTWRGVVGWLESRYQKTSSEAVRNDIEKYMSQKPCSKCKGSRYKNEVLLVTVNKKNIDEISNENIQEAFNFFDKLKLSKNEKMIADRIIQEIKSRLQFLNDVGLNYITLSRGAQTLSGGESQRIRLASQIGSQLVGVLYILDEPSIGLHARDNTRLLKTLKNLKNLGNTVITIEHDEETMRESDFLVDIGPRAGKKGGEIVASGSVEEVLKNKKSITAKYLKGEEKICVPEKRRKSGGKKSVILKGAREHNLKNINVEFPLNTFTCVTGVSGSGKSTLVKDTFYKLLANKIHKSLEVPGAYTEIIGDYNVDKIIMVDQAPIGRTPRSNPATYTGLFTPIRELFAATTDSKAKGYSPGRFSFNVPGGRCDNCKGEGYLKIEMQFMPDVYLPCDVCKEKRYNRETLEVQYKGKNISEVLNMTVSEALGFFENFTAIHDKLTVLNEVGLGYIELGQSATTLSGGEAQRVKLATELSRNSRGHNIYILDEPTTGLHFDDTKKLLNILNRLVDQGNTVIVIEHNMDIIKSADWIIDLGPEGGEEGGRILVTGDPEEVAKWHKESYTGQYLREALKMK